MSQMMVNDSDSGGSLEKINNPVAAIQIKPSRAKIQQLKSEDVSRSATNTSEAKKVRPKTSENMGLRGSHICGFRTGTGTPRSRKMIYLMHKRREIAQRRNRLLSDSLDPATLDQFKSESLRQNLDIVKPSFFEKVSD